MALRGCICMLKGCFSILKTRNSPPLGLIMILRLYAAMGRIE